MVEAFLAGVFFLVETFLAKAPLTEKRLEKALQRKALIMGSLYGECPSAPLSEAPLVEAPLAEALLAEVPLVEVSLTEVFSWRIPLAEAPPDRSVDDGPLWLRPLAEAPLAEVLVAEAPLVEALPAEAPLA